ncbi:MAG TPA: hypothetical protein VKB67_06130 [Rhizomicrobium sp.]|nr:hypothetical protein [Rhizomicrobium sp.]
MNFTTLKPATRTEAEVRAEIAELDDQAAQMFPAEWERANSRPNGSGEARRKLRERVKLTITLQTFRAQGATCDSCKHFKPDPASSTGMMICGFRSSSKGYVFTSEDNLCSDYARKEST